MRRIKILHTADIHFDTPFSGMTPKGALKSKEELKQVFDKIMKISLEREIDILLIAGDVFDNLSVNKTTLYFIKSCFEKISQVRVFISPGNHDPFNEKSFYSIVDWPSNVYIFKGEMENVILEDLNTVVWGVGFNTPHVNKSLLKEIRRIDGYNNIMVMHGEITTSKETNEYNPVTENEIAKSNMDYVALGHRHKFSGVKKIDNTYYSYCGCPQGRGFDELDDKGIVLIELKERFVESEFIKTSIRNYYEKEISIEGCFGYNEVKDKVINEILGFDRKNNFYKIILKGQVSEEFSINEEVLEELLKTEFYFVKVIDKSEIRLDINELMKGYSLKSIFAKKIYEKLQSAQTEEEKEIINSALKIGLQSISGDEVKMYDY
ncbi:metallophosphoesterase family protein [Clostridium chromiireducens]|uniref:Putative metallophosphoesterase YhaO n=1 Tax=Clostridium chromiireducens TaxID=225345 RepID=A0A1V4IPX0_9CLOT|nr:DNA repair exonuclease [Clostridium chromiireducens]OPJ62058.1 putative metallophosphoesterase YhaO [Clostridium chromiireducens]